MPVAGDGRSQNVGTFPDVTTVFATVEYRLVDGTVACPLAVTQQPVAAVVRSVASTSRHAGSAIAGTRSMSAELKLTSLVDPNGYAIFTNSSLTTPNGFEYMESLPGAGDANLYVQGNFVCANSATAVGSVTAPNGGAWLSNTCVVGGTLRVRDAVVMEGSGRVGADVYSSRGSVTLKNSARVGRDATMAGLFTGDTLRVGGTIRQSLAGLRDPATQELPVVTWDPAAWEKAKFTVEPVGTDCERIKTRMLAVTTPTVFYGECRLDFSGNHGDQQLRTDIAIVATKGFVIRNLFELESDDSSKQRKLWIIDPVTSVPPSCGEYDGGVTLGNQTDIEPSVAVFLYSDCTVNASNQSVLLGQIYGNAVTVAQSFKAKFASVAPPSVELVGNPDAGYKAQLVYKRETTSR